MTALLSHAAFAPVAPSFAAGRATAAYSAGSTATVTPDTTDDSAARPPSRPLRAVRAHQRDDALARFVERSDLLTAASPLKQVTPHNPYAEPISIETAESGDRILGALVAVLPYPYARASRLLVDPARLCEVLYLHINIKACTVRSRPTETDHDALLRVAAGRRDESAVDADHWIDNRLHVIASGADETRIELSAPEGPVGTRDFLVSMQLVPMSDDHTALRLRYGYTSGAMARAAMRTYMATLGKDKVGFTPVGHDGDGRPRLIGGIRGATERNLMRYYLAVEAAAWQSDPPTSANRKERLCRWHASAQRHARQLQELSLEDYLQQKLAGAAQALR